MPYFKILAGVLGLACIACQPTGVRPEPINSQTYFPIPIGGVELQLQLALKPAEQQKGLMYRESLNKDHGMLFLFDRPDERGFWMRNTRIPLDIGYFDSHGQLLEVHKLFPFDETLVISRSREVLIAVETNQGWYATNGIQVGDRIDMRSLLIALDALKQKNSSIKP
ncbi:MAG: DUF192 domain-containing protein [Puniceicoccaceae bacterium]|nr:DUF192 domain-containing protein [Puniceicoccaceae bacterium]